MATIESFAANEFKQSLVDLLGFPADLQYKNAVVDLLVELIKNIHVQLEGRNFIGDIRRDLAERIVAHIIFRLQNPSEEEKKVNRVRVSIGLERGRINRANLVITIPLSTVNGASVNVEIVDMAKAEG